MPERPASQHPDRREAAADQAGGDAIRAAQLLQLVQNLATELHPQMPRNISLSTRLDQELGFDSLTRVELILRIERHFAVSLPQHLLASAEQIADLLQALEQATPEKDAQASSPTLATAMRAGTVSEPREVETLPDLLAWHQARVPDRTHVILYDEQERAHEISYHDLGRNAQRIATALQQQGVVKGDRIALMLPTGSDYLYTFFAILLAGGLFLIGKSTFEIHDKLEGEEGHASSKVAAGFAGVIVQILLLDIVFSLDSVITAVGMVQHVPVMVAAVVAAVLVMLVAAGGISAFVERHPTIKILALSFLLLIGTSLVAEGLHFHIPKGYIYFAMAFSVGVEMLNLRLRRKSEDPIKLRQPIVENGGGAQPRR